MLNKKEVIKLNNEFVNESFQKMGDTYRGTIIVDIPKSLINSIRSNAKKELNFDSTENYSDLSVCDLIMEYLKNTYINRESIPVGELFGIDSVGEPGDAQTDIVPDDTDTEDAPLNDITNNFDTGSDMNEVETEL